PPSSARAGRTDGETAPGRAATQPAVARPRSSRAGRTAARGSRSAEVDPHRLARAETEGRRGTPPAHRDRDAAVRVLVQDDLAAGHVREGPGHDCGARPMW